MKEDYQKALRKLTLFFISNPVPFNGQSYQKQKGFGTSNQLLFRLQNKVRKILLLVVYFLTKFDDVNAKQFFKAFVHYFLSKFYFLPNDSPLKTMKSAFYFI